MSGLKELWGLGDPAALDPQISQRFEKEIQAFSAAVDRINQSLQFTAANSPADQHDPLAGAVTNFWSCIKKFSVRRVTPTNCSRLCSCALVLSTVRPPNSLNPRRA